MGPDGRIVALIHMALLRGFDRVQTLHSVRAVWFRLTQHRWIEIDPVWMRVEGARLAGPRAEEYVGELLRMMETSAPGQWAERADWVTRLIPLMRQLPPGPPPARQLTAEASASSWGCPSWELLGDLDLGTTFPGVFEGVRKVPALPLPSKVSLRFHIPPMVAAILRDLALECQLLAELVAVERRLAAYRAGAAVDQEDEEEREAPQIRVLELAEQGRGR